MITQFPSAQPGRRVHVAIFPVSAGERVALRSESAAVVMTIESMVAQAGVGGESFTLDRSGFLVTPSGCRLVLRTPAAASRVAVLGFRKAALTAAAEDYRNLGLTPARLARAFDRLQLLPRTVWIHELVHRYLFERCTLDEGDNHATRFLETEIAKEIFFFVRDRRRGEDRASSVRWHTPCVERSLAYLEAHLFEPCSVARLAVAAAASESTLLRAFHRELGCSPAAYWRSRKLDEALVLLRSGSRSVGEVAGHVGYDNATAFAHAFRLRFGRSPSTFLPKRPVRLAP